MVSAGVDHNCALENNGHILCWGQNDQGQLDVPPGTYITVDSGNARSCALTGAGSVVCWGSGLQSVKGIFTTISVNNFACGILAGGQVKCWGSPDLKHTPNNIFSELSTGYDHVCGISNGDILCWGNTEQGACDPPNFLVKGINAGTHHTCAIKENGIATCWGWDWLMGSSGPNHAPIAKLRQISSGYDTSCGITETYGVVCWGEGFSGIPQKDFTQISVGQSHVCGITNGNISCWGCNQNNPQLCLLSSR